MGLGPSRMATPRTGLEDAISKGLLGILGGAAGTGAPAAAPPGGGKVPTNFGGGSGTSGKAGAGTTGGQPSIQDIFTNLSLPGYGGALTAPTSPLQRGAIGASQSGLDALPGFQQFGNSVLGGLAGVPGQSMAPDALMNLLNNRPGSDILTQLTGPGGAIEGLTKLGSGEGEGSFAGIVDSLNRARQGSLSDDLRNISERFSASGLRQSTDLAGALGETSNRSEANWLAQAAQLIPQITSARTGALTAAGQLGLGAGGTLQQGGLQAADIMGSLFQGQQGRGLQALMALPGAAQLFANLPNEVATGSFNLGSAQQGLDTQALQALYNEFTRTSGGLLAPILNFAAGAPQITGPGKGSQLLGAGTTLGAAAL